MQRSVGVPATALLRSAVPQKIACRRCARLHRSLSSRSTPAHIPPFTTASLRAIRSSLVEPPSWTLKNPPPHTVAPTKRPIKEAAILIPLMNVNDEPHVLLEVRASHMRVHAGEVSWRRVRAEDSFPGGRLDPTDSGVGEAALRETEEELALPRDNVEILGMLDSPEYSLGNRSRVWPLVGFVHSSHPPDSQRTDHPLPSYGLSKLTPSPDEVSSVFSLPLSALHDPKRLVTHYFRLDIRRPYQKIRVSDLVDPEALGGADTRAHGELEVWGLSGWFLNRLAWTLGWLDKPPAYPYES